MKMPGRRTIRCLPALLAIGIPAASQLDLEWRTEIDRQGFRRTLTPGHWFPVTLTFRQAAPVTVLVAAGPLPAPR